MASNTNLLEQQLDILKDIRKSVDPTKTGNTDPTRDMNRKMLKYASKGIALATNHLSVSKELLSSFRSADRLQRKSLSQGITLNNLMKRNADEISFLSDDITGIVGALEISQSFFSVGLRQNSKELSLLGARTRETGGSVQNLAKSLAANTVQGLLSRDDMADLSVSMISLSTNFGISTEQLASALGEFSSNISNFGALGIGGKMTKAGVEIASVLEPAMANVGVRALNTITSGNKLVLANLLGVSRLRMDVLTGQAGGLKLVTEASLNAARLQEQFLKSNSGTDRMFLLSKISGIFGEGFDSLASVGRQLERLSREGGFSSVNDYIAATKKNEKNNRDFLQNWETFKSLVLNPLMKFGITIATSVQEVLGTKLAVQIGQIVLALGILSAAVITLGPALSMISGIAGLLGGGAALGGVAAGGAAAAGSGILAPLLGIGLLVGGLTAGTMALSEYNKSSVSQSKSAGPSIQRVSTDIKDRLSALVSATVRSNSLLESIDLRISVSNEHEDLSLKQGQQLIGRASGRPSDRRDNGNKGK